VTPIYTYIQDISDFWRPFLAHSLFYPSSDISTCPHGFHLSKWQVGGFLHEAISRQEVQWSIQNTE